ncbi:TfoX/Sxy family DNA transformation protein [[Enterobacter] lignolyticus]|uniref:Competence protein n=1 Tax=[Enterobacter] lignolyticus TaxID=1334193 RepID=A0A806XBG1_9ENTR|nr:TfoX/Sxy family DNA transformation protein [[Enterobacter] lignolyticus]ALR76237.1 competence protein [[Enterobacter] lignolyticus]
MKKLSYQRIYESEECLSPLGKIRHRALFGGYSLSVDDTVFAMVAEGELYLRVCEESATYHVTHPPTLLTLSKRGRRVSLNYYRVDDELWLNRPLLLQLSKQALGEALQEKRRRRGTGRLKDLPNISFQLEMLLHESGVKDPQTLRALGSATVWFRLRRLRKDLNVSVLFALEGAILGLHAAAIPHQRRQHLQEWAEMLTQEKKG